MIEAGTEIVANAYNTEGRAISELVDEAERRIFEIAEQGRRRGSGFVHLREILPEMIDRSTSGTRTSRP